MDNNGEQNLFEHLIIEWDENKNNGTKLSDFAKSSNKYAWWICSKGHYWKARIAHRYNGSGCSYCANRRVIEGYNDLENKCPSLVKKWNYKWKQNCQGSNE